MSKQHLNIPILPSLDMYSQYELEEAIIRKHINGRLITQDELKSAVLHTLLKHANNTLEEDACIFREIAEKLGFGKTK